MKKNLLDIKNIKAEIDTIEWPLTIEKNISLSILRLDKIHSAISGNKFFKLYYFLQQAISQQKKIITFGGAYSNHLAATASACKMFGIDCIGIVRGDEPKDLSHTLLFCKEQGMCLHFISREKYKKKDTENFKKELTDSFGDHLLIPEGGYCNIGMKGAELISNFYTDEKYNYIICSVGTATTFAALINSAMPFQNIIGFSALKNITDMNSRINFLLGSTTNKKYALLKDCYFGGYAKKTNELILFMNKLYEEFLIPTDFVYTAKMMFGVFELIKKNYFSEGSKILCIHTGGLQGNRSLPKGTLNF